MQHRLVTLLALAVPVLFLALGANSIWDANEAFYVETPRQMVETGDYISPSFNDQPRFNKPVLSYWVVAGLYQAFGVSVTVERVGIAIGALGVLLATFLAGRALHSTAVGALAALAVATAPRFVLFSRRIFIDIWITAFMALTLACFVLAYRHPERRRTWLLLMYVAVGLGVLTKGPQAIVLPAAAFGIWLVVEGRLADLRRLWIVPGACIVVAIAAPWWLLQIPEHGTQYIREFWVGENLGRYAESMVPGGRSPLFYLPVLFGDLFPWAPLLVVPILTAWRGRQPDERVETASIRRLLWIWVVVIVGAFTTSATKQDLYILPVVPAVAALVAYALATTDYGRAHRGVRAALLFVAALCAMAGAGVIALLADGPFAVRDAVLLGAVLVATGVAVLALTAMRRGQAAVLTLAAGFVVFNYGLVLRALPDVERLKPVPPLARVLDARAGPDETIAALLIAVPSLVYYADRPIEEVYSLDRAAEILTGSAPAWVITGADEWVDLGPRLPGACVVFRHPDFAFNARLSDIIAQAPPPDVVLVHNRCAG